MATQCWTLLSYARVACARNYNFIIGSSCDYSFIPEMCPSGNVETITDLRRVFGRRTAATSSRSWVSVTGPLQPRRLADSLGEWTTAIHRDNARTTLVFHAGELPAELASKIAEADAFVDRVANLLKNKPRPHRGHPYWYGAVAAFRDAKDRSSTTMSGAMRQVSPGPIIGSRNGCSSAPNTL